MSKLEVKDGETKVENKVIRNFIRGLAALILSSYTVYVILMKWKHGSVSLDSIDFTLMGAALAGWITVEGVRAYVTRKLEN